MKEEEGADSDNEATETEEGEFEEEQDSEEEQVNQLTVDHTGAATLNRRVLNDQLGQTGGGHNGSLVVAFEEDRLVGELSWQASLDRADRINPDTAADIQSYQLVSREQLGAFDVTTALGDQEINYDPALLSALQRRGAAFDFDAAEYGLGFGAFALRGTDTAFGVENFTGLEADSDQIYGANVRFKPIQDDRVILALSAYSGEANQDGFISQGSGVAFSLTGTLDDAGTTYSSVFALADFDPDVSDPAFGNDRSNGLKADVTQQLWSFENGAMSAEAGYERTELGFQTLGSSDLSPGVETIRLSTNYADDRWDITSEGVRQIDKIGGPNDVATNQTVTAGLQVNFTPFQAVDTELEAEDDSQDPLEITPNYSAWSWAEGLSLRANYNVSNTDQINDPTGDNPDEDQTTHSTGVGFTLQRDLIDWGVDYTFSQTNDQGDLNFDNISHNITTSFTLTPSDRFDITFGPFTYDYLFDQEITRSFSAEISANYVLLPDLLNFSLTSAYETTDNTGGVDSDTDGRQVSSTLRWTPIERLGVEFAFGFADGVRREFDDDDEEWFGSLSIDLDTSFSR